MRYCSYTRDDEVRGSPGNCVRIKHTVAEGAALVGVVGTVLQALHDHRRESLVKYRIGCTPCGLGPCGRTRRFSRHAVNRVAG
jgi:hypothetical protein